MHKICTGSILTSVKIRINLTLGDLNLTAKSRFDTREINLTCTFKGELGRISVLGLALSEISSLCDQIRDLNWTTKVVGLMLTLAQCGRPRRGHLWLRSVSIEYTSQKTSMLKLL